MNWFTIEEIDKKTYAISEYRHWEQVHSYLLIGKSFALLIDSGLGVGSIREEVEKLTDLPVRVVATHVHWDHIGGHKEFDYVYVHEGDLTWLKRGLPVPLEVVKKEVVRDVEEFPEDFDINEYKLYTGYPSCVLKDHDIIDLGERKIEVIHTPGHAPGHICLYDNDSDYLFSGDLIYSGTLYAFYPSTDPVQYKASVEKIIQYKNMTRLLPAHNDLNIPIDLVTRVHNAFMELDDICDLKQGSGLFKYGDFSIHI